MRFESTVIESFAYHDPEIVLSSEELEKSLMPVYERLKLPEGRLELQTGIRNRGYFECAPSEIATRAASKALEKSNIKREEIDLLIHSSVCRDFLEPSTASVVHKNLGLSPHCVSFDLSNACLGFLNAMMVAAGQIESGVIKNALIVSGENAGPLIKETIQFLNSDRSLTRKSIKKFIANLTIGSAGVAFVLTHKDIAPGLAALLGASALCDTEHVKLCQGDGNTSSLMMETHSEELLHAGIGLAKKTWECFKKDLSWQNTDVMHVVAHQVGIAHRNLLLDSLGLSRDIDTITYDQYGNTGSAACPLTLIKAFEKEKFSSGDTIAMLGIGSGLHSIMVGLKWN